MTPPETNTQRGPLDHPLVVGLVITVVGGLLVIWLAPIGPLWVSVAVLGIALVVAAVLGVRRLVRAAYARGKVEGELAERLRVLRLHLDTEHEEFKKRLTDLEEAPRRAGELLKQVEKMQREGKLPSKYGDA